MVIEKSIQARYWNNLSIKERYLFLKEVYNTKVTVKKHVTKEYHKLPERARNAIKKMLWSRIR